MVQNEIIRFSNVTFKYDEDEPTALENVTFNIKRGKWTSIVGHNGSGKSTIAKLLMGINNNYEGDIIVKDIKVSEENIDEVRKHIGIVFQNPENQFVGSTVEYDVAFGLENHAVTYEKMRELVPKALLDVDMLDRAEYEPQSLSGGQKQRVAIAGVLALNTDIIILDEATSMLDPAGRKELLTLIHQLKADNDVTIISITHDLSEAAEADHLVVLNEGTVFQTGLPQSIFNYADRLTDIGLDLPFSIRMNQYLSDTTEYITYEGLLKKL